MDVLPRKKPKLKAAEKSALALPNPVNTVRSAAKKRSRKSFKKAIIRYSIVAVNLLIVGIATFLVLTHSDSNAASFGSNTMNEDAVVSPLDKLSAADIAVNIARMANLPETAAVTNYADTINSELETFTVDKDVAQIPQIITANIKTLADIKQYETVKGDTISKLAEKFSVTSDSIKWSNDLTEDALQAGIKLVIPPMNGIIYTVHSGDTAEKIAQKYKASAEQIIAFNDAELSGLKPGKQIFIPNGQKPAPVFSFFVRYGYNGYDPGWCTYYAAEKGGAPAGWGHARTWAVYAARTPGWAVSKVPVPGAIAQTTGVPGGRVGWSWGHVGVVENVKFENGQYYIKYSDMNGLAGFNRVGYSDWVPALEKYQNFIYRVE